jgi:hypothetical protein
VQIFSVRSVKKTPDRKNWRSNQRGPLPAGGQVVTIMITSLNGSVGIIKDHGDVTNDAVTYAFASAVART